MKIVGFYTPQYAQHAQECIESARAVGWDARFTEFPSEGSWVLNCGIKPRFLAASLSAGERLLYVDADARFRAAPDELAEIPAGSFDIGFHRMNFELLSGTLLLEPTDVTRALLQRWHSAMQSSPHLWDQRVLDHVLGDARVHELAPEWCLITDIGRRRYPGVEPKIEHLQASRKMRKAVV